MNFDGDLSTAAAIEAAYLAARNGEQVSAKPFVCMLTPAYTAPEVPMLATRDMVAIDLDDHGIPSIRITSEGDSLVTRGRHTLMHQFLMTPATHLLFWDADIECLDRTSVRKMLETRHDVIGGAYPFRNGSGGVVCNGLAEQEEAFVDKDGCIEVGEIGTGFLLVSRLAIVAMCERYHAETFYRADLMDSKGEPRWALFDVGIRNGRYLSEDYVFCHRWRDMGGKVYVYTPPIFRHWGKHGHEGHILTAWGARRAAE